MTTHILIVDDDPLRAKMLTFLLVDAGYAASTLADPRAADCGSGGTAVDLALVDATAPSPDGFALCARLKRRDGETPVIVMGERHTTDDLVRAFAQGADDYVARPYDPAELLARVQAVLRRYRRVERNRFGATVRVGGTSLDLGALAFSGASGCRVAVTPTEMRLLECLMRNANAVISREKLIVETWGYDSGSADNRIDVYIRRLRRKIEAHAKDRDLIRTVRGIGYTFHGDPGNDRPERGRETA
jgi:two-component system, OmpR family, response regulator RegX3